MKEFYERPENVDEWDPPLGPRPKLNISEEERQKKIQEALERARILGVEIQREQNRIQNS